MTTTTTPSSSTKTTFSPHIYLQSQGWTPGQPLTSAPNARARPITIVHKMTLSGLGKDRDRSYNWWEVVFEGLAGKVKKEHDRTSTGLISPLPPRPQPSALDSHYQSTPSTSTSTSTGTSTGGGGGLNWEAMGHAKMEIARRQLYASFLRGTVIGSTVGEEEVVVKKEEVMKEEDVVKEEMVIMKEEMVIKEEEMLKKEVLQGVKRENKDWKGKDKNKKKKGKEVDVNDDEGIKKRSRKRQAEEEIKVEGKEVTGKASKKSKKKDRREKKDKDASSTTVDERDAEVDEAQEIARMVAKEEWRRENKLAQGR
ncbi:hypothetical protein MVLG_03379 [Microbotryum lychnidis-dioicae p1A1 Lamole]|uniref:G-patch domain-containing protein n=1 Tax=Microbotryum lychnidis-dioicae (strain p1A1 Lamole / MvSl-1064) TaxID=683840 RepID=U5H812_USTV1|nr:hypothetical protein MVLG_03379 [Microbotryum lychnidis-dioicae p1A1 Lamole]|eukprot:KDE06342.1 hypothetical protein MVLG_03379 [Microbotryum lychnidis-dioicae p1A1 Lamole]